MSRSPKDITPRADAEDHLQDRPAARRSLLAWGTAARGLAVWLAAVASAGGGRKRGEPIPLNVAFREITRFVVAELNASGEQWSENSRQDLVSTLLIAAQKANLLGVWERGEAA